MEWLTTGQMIDRLKVGEKAISENNVWHIIYHDTRGIEWNDSTGGYLYLKNAVLNNKWRILPKYVSFEEAVKALKGGKTVYYEGKFNWHHKITPHEFEQYCLSALTVKENGLKNLIEENWTIED